MFVPRRASASSISSTTDDDTFRSTGWLAAGWSTARYFTSTVHHAKLIPQSLTKNSHWSAVLRVVIIRLTRECRESDRLLIEEWEERAHVLGAKSRQKERPLYEALCADSGLAQNDTGGWKLWCFYILGLVDDVDGSTAMTTLFCRAKHMELEGALVIRRLPMHQMWVNINHLFVDLLCCNKRGECMPVRHQWIIVVCLNWSNIV